MADSVLRDKTKQFAKDIVFLCREIKSNHKEAVLVNQLLRSSTSIGANLHEAQYAQSKNDFISKLEIAQKECYESEYWRELLFETDCIAVLTLREFCIQYKLRNEMIILYNDSFKARYKKAPLAIDVTIKKDTPSHVHSEFEIIYVKRGMSEIEIGTDTVIARSGDLIFVNPMEVHSVTLKGTEDYLHYCMCFDVSLISDPEVSDALLDGTMSSLHQIEESHPYSTQIRECFNRLFNLVEKGTDTLLLEGSAYVSLMFAHMINGKILSKTVRRDKKSMFYSKVIKYISENYSKDITSKDPAREMFYTQSHFCRSFARSFGIPFSSFLNIYRISKAKEMLENPNVKISDVAQRCGFGNLNYFTRCFRKNVGMPPSEYKKHQ